MKCQSKGHILTAATAVLALATTILVPTALVPRALVQAAWAEDPSSTLNPGFVPNTGQINPGHAAQPWSAAPALPQAQQPAQEDARAALMMPDNGAPSAGQGNQAGQASQTGPGNQAGQGGQQGAPSQNSGAQSGPIGSTVQTMPAKFSKRNDLLDHMPMMAWPLPLNEQQRAQIYQAVMNDKSQPVEGAASLKPASSLSYDQRRDLQPLPQSVTNIDGLQDLKYVKGKDKVFLVRPSSGIVVDEIAMAR
jgi:hypothetical protein